MSTLLSDLLGGTGGVKSVQKVTVTGTGNYSISAVDTSKTILVLPAFGGEGGSSYFGYRANLTSSTNVNIGTVQGATNSATVYLFVVEYN